jgi:hypothetical protein
VDFNTGFQLEETIDELAQVGIGIRLRAEQPRNRNSTPGRGKELFFTASRPLGTSQPLIQPGVKQFGYEGDHSPPSGAEVINQEGQLRICN